jgi:coproporphyrinogen III oxidase, anaerobic (EC 1.3.99.22)
MYKWVNRGHLPAPDDDLAADMYELATDLLAEAGYIQYEISNWSKLVINAATICNTGVTCPILAWALAHMAMQATSVMPLF